ncbi:glycoside hydrolase family 31 protein [candidate division KSB1 bacterium]
MKKAVILISISFILYLCNNLSGAVTSDLIISDNSDCITAKTPNYIVKINKSPYLLTILTGNKAIIKNEPGENQLNGSFFIRSNKKHHISNIEKWSDLTNGLLLIANTTYKNQKANILFTFHKDYINIDWNTDDNVINDQIGENFSLKTSGHWYGGNVTSAHNWPLETGSITLDPYLASSNQTTPFWLTSSGAGIFIDTYNLMGFSINKENDGLFSFNIKNVKNISYKILIGKNIVKTYYTFINLIGKPQVVPPIGYFEDPIFNTWIEYGININQEDVANYAKKIRESGFPCTILDIDDMWTTYYGDHEFNPEKFPNPKKMVDELHSMRFKVSMWIVPFIHTDSKNFQYAKKNGYLIMDKSGTKPAFVNWWNGTAALIDLSNPSAFHWFLNDMKSLEIKYGTDGVKLDGGDAEYYKPEFTSFGSITPNRYTDLFAMFGKYYSINELRVSWLSQSLGLVQRLRDKYPTWSDKDGLCSLISNGLTNSMIGYPFFCPDMIGGGDDEGFKGDKYKGMDPEMFVRWTQASALMPMMQFSFAPWNLDEKSTQICKKYALLHKELGEYIYRFACKAKNDGTPIVRPLFFINPEDENTYYIKDQFFLGDKFLAAPVQEKGAVSRDIYLPSGLWSDFWNGELYKGKQTIKSYHAPIEKLPIFIKIM